MRRSFVGLIVGAVLILTTVGTASSASTGMATGSLTYESWAGIETIALLAEGSPAAASGWMQFKRESTTFSANSGGPVTCYLQVGNRGYFAGRFARTFFSGPTEILFFNGVVVDGDQTGEADRAFIMLGADAPIPCDEPGTMSFLDSWSFAATGGNIVVH